ncbi:MAG: TetR/AcrR family transcriptional regulator [Rhodobacteraceae bacterium]|jgi:AcrR family transcriptional regulator|nr:TetR/AcrR family transcriptional regulator [Paracoccaceae bacterium]
MGQVQDIIRTGRKFDQVVNGARDIFMAVGFERASVDDIARAAGVSKATLYSYFPDKQLLFMEVVRCECKRHAGDIEDLVEAGLAVDEALSVAAERILSIILSDFSQRVFRICVAEADRFPELGRQFYENGPLVVRGQLSAYLQKAVAAGELHIDDFDLAADQFAELCRADLFPRLVFGIDKSFEQEEVQRVIAGAVSMFLARYGRR